MIGKVLRGPEFVRGVKSIRERYLRDIVENPEKEVHPGNLGFIMWASNFLSDPKKVNKYLWDKTR